MPDEEGKFIVTKEWFELSEQRRKEFDAKYEKLHEKTVALIQSSCGD